jgi:retinol dehydrogenase 12
MTHPVCIVTGANSGIGEVTATDLAKQGATVVMLCRNPAKAEAARQRIVAQTGNSRVEVLLVDFASQAQVRRVAAEFMAKYPRLHVLVNNAGFLAGDQRQTTEDGIEATLAVNHLGYFLLTACLWPVLTATAQHSATAVRVVNVASEAHRFPVYRFRLNDLQFERHYSGIAAYCASKMANIMFTHQLAQRIKAQGLNLTANCLHPGGVASNFGEAASGWFGWAMKLAKPFFISSEQGARTSIYLATSPQVEEVSGRYFSNGRAVAPAKLATDAQATARLWAESERLVNTPFLS